MTLSIRPPRAEDAAELLDFECRNRAWFESTINARDPAYYSAAGIAAAIGEADAARAADRAHQFLVHDDGRLVGRVNLHAVRRGPWQCAELGYRVDRAENGRGIASRAVALALDEAFGPLALWRVEAVVRPENPASIRVLERNGFVRFGHSRRAFQLGGTWYDRLLFERHREDVVDAA
jgi:ribosomal-protein-alanine N-acetyltransferase